MGKTRLHPECMKCLVDKYMCIAPKGTPKELEMAYIRRFLSILANAPEGCSAPVLLADINALRCEMYGSSADYTQIKRHFNQLMLTQEAWIAQQIDQSDDPLEAAVRFAMIGNYIDFGAQNAVNEQQLQTMLADQQLLTLELKAFEQLKHDVQCMKRLVYLTDNCGEIVTDKLLLQTIHQINPNAELTAIVRGADVLNDATLEDAQQVHLEDAAHVISNGTGVAGTWLEAISTEARERIQQADVIISKGQANFETLYNCGMNVYYLFLCKCALFANRFGVQKLTGLLLNDRELGDI